MKRRSFIAMSMGAAAGAGGLAQNVVVPTPVDRRAAPVKITAAQALTVLDRPWISPALTPVVEREVAAFCDGHPWRPFHSVLGISGFETYFSHPDDLFFVLSLAGPGASPRLRPLLMAEMEIHPPFGEPGYDPRAGRPRELYDVPADVLPKEVPPAGDAFGVYAFALFCHRFASVPTAAHLDAVRARVAPLLDRPSEFNPERTDGPPDAAEHLNGDLAGLIGAWRLSRTHAPDAAYETALVARLRDLLERRVALDRRNPHVWTATHFSSQSLHTGSVARSLRLTPELGWALAQWTDGLAAARVAALRRQFPTWWIARGDRLVGGENYISPLHFSRALWQATAWIDGAPDRGRGVSVDIPWCRGDLAFLEKCLLPLR